MIGMPEIDAGAALALLLRATLAVSLAVLVLWPLRRALRRRFGAGVAYAAWWLIPAVALACLLPARVQEAVLLAAPPAQMATPAATVLAEAPTFSIPPGFWLSLWALGALGMALRLWRQQRRFERALGELQPLPQRLWRSTARSGLPAVVGALRARIVLPEDFAQRYDAEQQGLLLAHERTHLHRGDPLANLAVAALRCLFWFNPLVSLAAARFRHDQELACDQAVIAAHPNSRRAYGEAMLKTLMTDRQAPLGCHWGFSHPLKERVMQLTSSAPRPWARRVGVAAVALSILGAGFAVWSAQPPRYVAASGDGSRADSPADFRAELQLRIDDDAPTRFAIANDYGKPFSFAHRGDDGERLQIEGVVRETADRGHDIALVLKRDGREIAKPRLIAARNAPAVVRLGGESPAGVFDGVELTLAIAPGDAPAPPAPPSPPHAPAVLAPLAEADQLAPMAPPARPAALVPLDPPAPLAPPAPPSQPAPSAPPAPPAPPASAPVAHDVDTARIARAVRTQTARAEAARMAARSAQADAARHAAQAEAVRADVARAAAAAYDAEEAARAAEAMAAGADTEVAAARRARNAAMSEQQRAAEMAATRAQIAGERERLRAAAARDAAARDAAAAQAAAAQAAAEAALAPEAP